MTLRAKRITNAQADAIKATSELLTMKRYTVCDSMVLGRGLMEDLDLLGSNSAEGKELTKWAQEKYGCEDPEQLRVIFLRESVAEIAAAFRDEKDRENIRNVFEMTSSGRRFIRELEMNSRVNLDNFEQVITRHIAVFDKINSCLEEAMPDIFAALKRRLALELEQIGVDVDFSHVKLDSVCFSVADKLYWSGSPIFAGEFQDSLNVIVLTVPSNVFVGADFSHDLIRVINESIDFTEVINHELMHWLSGTGAVELSKTGSPSSVFSYKLGLFFGGRFHWANEAFTVEMTDLLSDYRSYRYGPDRLLLSALRTSGTREIGMDVLAGAYFENYSSERGFDFPKWRALSDAIKESYYDGFLVEFDDYVKERGIKEAYKFLFMWKLANEQERNGLRRKLIRKEKVFALIESKLLSELEGSLVVS